jgi:hypothetical protein
MSARPWFKFFPSDWRGDANLRACSPLARGLWIEMVCLMEMAEPYGHLVVAGRALTEEMLAKQAAMTPDDVRAGLAELEAAAVFNRGADGMIYSRRMLRAAEVRRKRAEGGGESIKNQNVPQPKCTAVAATPLNSVATPLKGKDTLQGYPSRTKDTLQGSPQIPDARCQRPETKRQDVASSTRGGSESPQKRAGRETWLTPFASAWEAQYGGCPSFGRTARALFPLVKEHGTDVVLEHWVPFLRETPARFATPEKFAQTFGSWSPKAGPRALEVVDA